MEIGPFRLADIVVLVTVLGGAWALIAAINRAMKRVNHLFEDFLGVEGRPGIPGRKGVLERMDEDEQSIAWVRAAVIRIERLLRQHDRNSERYAAEVAEAAKQAGITGLPRYPRTLPDEEQHELEGE